MATEVEKENQLNIDSNELKLNGFQVKTCFLQKMFFDVQKENQLNIHSNEKMNGFTLNTLSHHFLCLTGKSMENRLMKMDALQLNNFAYQRLFVFKPKINYT